MKKKTISWILTVCMILLMIPQFIYADQLPDEEAGPITKCVSVSGYNFGNTEQNPYLVDLTFDDAWLSSYCPAVYNGGLAVFASLLSSDMYTNTKVEVRDGQEGDETSFLSGFGFEEIRCIRVPDGTEDGGLPSDPDDESYVLFGHKLTEQNGRKYDMVIAAVQGTDSSLSGSQWSSNFDVGSPDQSYSDLTGEHPDWSNTDNHKGFDVTANRIDSALRQYTEELNHESDVTTTYLFTGHSRGAAAADILGARYEQKGEQSCAYTFATPETTTVSEEEAASYRTVFNHINENDFVSELPLKSWGFRRYGQDLTLDVSKAVNPESPEYDGEVCQIVNSVLGEGEYASMQDLDQFLTSLGAVSSDRNELYNNAHEGDSVTDSFDSERDMDSSFEADQTAIDILKLGKFVSLEKSGEGSGAYTVTRKLCPAFFMHGLARLIEDYRSGETMQLMSDYLSLGLLLRNTRYSSILTEIMSVILEDSSALSFPHFSVIGYAIATHYQKTAADQDFSHHWNDWEVKKEPTSEEEGLRERSCAVCGCLETEKTEKLPLPDLLPFTDVQDRKAWYYGPVDYVYRHFIMKGMSDTFFDVNGKLTRAQFATILYRLAGSPEVESASRFTDIEAGQWYEAAVIWGSGKEIIKGYDDGRFGPSDRITREQIAALMYRYAGSPALEEKVDLSGFLDSGEISGYALDVVKWCVGRGLINGMGDGTLAPQGETTRAQCAAIIQRYMPATARN